MPLSRFASALILGSLGFAQAPAPAASGLQPSSLPRLLGAAAAYVATYEARVAAFVFEEDYRQRVTCLFGGIRSQARRLRSEVVVVNTGDLGWIGFRDVFEVDGQPVRNREDRLQQLFLDAGPDALARARALADESARFNLGGVERNLNYPTMALLFLREAHQGRSRFSRGDSERVDGVLTWAVRFEETRRPTLIGSRLDDVVASGEFWIEPDAGRVRRSRLRVEEERATGTIDVLYAPWPNLDVLMPVSMKENHSVRGCDPGSGTVSARGVETIQGEAQYSNVRQFTVDVKMEMHPEGR
jgi:hypothetical protein